jgi:conjugative relaxase-like TrwC/TraI family protein
MTVCENGQSHALQERSLFQSQHYVTSVYRSELAMRLQELGYEIETGRYGQPEIKGYTQEYLDASSPRRKAAYIWPSPSGVSPPYRQW